MVSPSSEAITTTGEEARDQRDGRARRERNEAVAGSGGVRTRRIPGR